MADTENTQEVEVMLVASPTIELQWIDTTLAISGRKESESLLSKETSCTSQLSTWIRSGLWCQRTLFHIMLKTRIKFQSSM